MSGDTGGAQPVPVRVPSPRRTELIGLAPGGRMLLFDTDREVVPCHQFVLDDRGLIEAGYYIVEWRSHAITAYCQPCYDGSVHFHFACARDDDRGFALPRGEAETMLLGRVIPSDSSWETPDYKARIQARVDARRAKIIEAEKAPHRQRGWIGAR